MEPFLGCLAVVVVLLVLGGPVVALVFALQARRQARELTAIANGDRAEVAILRERLIRLERRMAAEGAVPERPPTLVAPVVTEPPREPQAPREPESRETRSVIATPIEPPPIPQVASPTPIAEIPPSAPALPEYAAAAVHQPGLEERLGARLPVWLGGIALALAGAFLVKYSVDQGWLSPTVRVALGLLFGVGLLGFGEWLRERSPMISQAVSAAGIADLYAVLLAGIRLYHLIPPLYGFLLMAGNTAVAVLLALRQGPMVALLGLVGGFATPALVSTGSNDVRGLVAYLFLLDAGLMVVTRRRRWPVLALGALVASLGWVAIWIAGVYRPGDGLFLGAFLLASTALFAGAALRARPEEPWIESGLARMLAFGALCGGQILLAILVRTAGYGPLEWGMFALLAAGCYVLAARREELFALAPFAAVTTGLLLASRGIELHPEDARGYLITLALFSAGLAGGAWVVLLRSLRPARWATIAAAVLIFLPLIGYATTRNLIELPWALVALALAALAIAAAVPVALRRDRMPEAEESLAALAVAATLHASAALPLALDRAWLSVAFALEAPLLLALRAKLRVPALGTLAAIAGGLAAARLLFNPEVIGYASGTTPVVNWLLWGYGVPLVAFLVAAAIARREADPVTGTGFEIGASAFAFALVTLEVWHYFSGGILRDPFRGWGMVEWGTQAVAWFLLAGILIEAGSRFERPVFSVAGRLLVAAAGAQALLVHGGIENPAWTSNPVGATPIANALLLAFGAPAVFLLLAARRVARDGGAKLPPTARIAAALLTFGLLTLEVRQLFRGSDLSTGDATNAEQFAYSAAWVLFGTALLVLGIARGSKALRFSALAVMLLAVIKVFLFDTSELEDLYRVFSFLGLGASLLVLAHLYQRFVFRAEGRR